MTTAALTRKIPGGKLLRLEVSFSERIESVKLTGDFFLHPEDTLDLLTAALQAAPLPLDPPALTAQLTRLLAENQAELIGASPADLVSILQEALACPPSA
jgi:lipoate-protein ligase A